MLAAILCIAFGTMTLIAMTLLSRSIEQMLVLEAPQMIGADVTLDREADDIITEENEATLEQMQTQGKIDQYTLIAYSSSLTIRMPQSRELEFPSVGMGVDPGVYPLAGQVTIQEPDETLLSTLLAQPGDVVLTNDLASAYHLKVGDAISLSDLRMAVTVPAVVRGIASDTPNHQGSKVYYALETARLLAGGQRTVNTVLANAAEPDLVRSELEQIGWRVFTAQELANADKATQRTFEFGLNGAGVLALLISAVAIANTMQVLLQRRRKEAAIWKTIGYTGEQLQRLFVIEAALVGAIGSVLGAVVGVGLSFALVDVFSRTTTLLIQWVFSWPHFLLSILIGITTAIIFSLWAIVSTSQVSPQALLRKDVMNLKTISAWKAVSLVFVVLIPFIAIASVIMDSVWKGTLVLVATVVGLAGFGVSLNLFAGLVIKLMPFKRWPVGRLARTHLHRRELSLIFAMTAVFLGVIILTTGVVTTSSAKAMVDILSTRDSEENLAVYAAADQFNEVKEAFRLNEITDYYSGSQANVLTITSAAQPEAVISPLLIGRPENSEYRVVGEAWGSQSDGVYVPAGLLQIPLGSTLSVTSMNGSIHEFTVAGTYYLDQASSQPGTRLGILMPEDLLKSITPAESVRFFARVPQEKLTAAAQTLEKALPHATVINLEVFSMRYLGNLQNLFIFIGAIAGLLLLAGVLLIANSVSLAMLNRRYEIGVLKAVGYGRRHILQTLMVEYSLIAAIATFAAMAVVGFIMFIINVFSGSSALVPETVKFLQFSVPSMLGIFIFVIGFVLLMVYSVSWKPTQISPMIVLNEHE